MVRSVILTRDCETERSLAFGDAIGMAVMLRREDDGSASTAIGQYANGHYIAEPGRWRPIPPNFQPPLDPQWAILMPYVMTTPNQFRPAAPPALDSVAFAVALKQVMEMGARNAAART